MSAALIYRPNQRWQIWVAFAGAALIHLGAVAIAANRTTNLPPPLVGEQVIDVEVFPDSTEPAPPIEPDEAPPPPMPLPPAADETFPAEETATPPPLRERQVKAVQPLVRRTTTGPAGPTSMRAAKVLAISAPRPEYPYEARRQRITGSGVAVLTVNAAGHVTDVAMIQSTGSPALDNATISGFRRWRFKPGTVSKVQTPITFTLTGASY